MARGNKKAAAKVALLSIQAAVSYVGPDPAKSHAFSAGSGDPGPSKQSAEIWTWSIAYAVSPFCSSTYDGNTFSQAASGFQAP